MPKNKGLHINAIREEGNTSFVELTVFTSEAERVEIVNIDSTTAKSIVEVCSQQPFKKRLGEKYSYWVTGVGHNEQIEHNGFGHITRTHPTLYLMIRRGRSRLEVRVSCTIRDWEYFRPLSRETWNEKTREGLEKYEATKRYRWGNSDETQP